MFSIEEMQKIEKEYKSKQAQTEAMTAEIEALSQEKITKLNEITKIKADVAANIEISKKLHDELHMLKAGIKNFKDEMQSERDKVDVDNVLLLEKQAEFDAHVKKFEQEKTAFLSQKSEYEKNLNLMREKEIKINDQRAESVEVSKRQAQKEDELGKRDLEIRAKRQDLEKRLDEVSEYTARLDKMHKRAEEKDGQLKAKEAELIAEKSVIKMEQDKIAAKQKEIDGVMAETACIKQEYIKKEIGLTRAFEALHTKEQELEVKRLRLEKLIKEKDLAKEITELENELNA
jgi:hypothetical protein